MDQGGLIKEALEGAGRTRKTVSVALLKVSTENMLELLNRLQRESELFQTHEPSQLSYQKPCEVQAAIALLPLDPGHRVTAAQARERSAVLSRQKNHGNLQIHRDECKVRIRLRDRETTLELRYLEYSIHRRMNIRLTGAKPEIRQIRVKSA